MKKAELSEVQSFKKFAIAAGLKVISEVRQTQENKVPYIVAFATDKDGKGIKDSAQMICLSRSVSEDVEVGKHLTKEQLNTLRTGLVTYANGDSRRKIISASDSKYTELAFD